MEDLFITTTDNNRLSINIFNDNKNPSDVISNYLKNNYLKREEIIFFNDTNNYVVSKKLFKTGSSNIVLSINNGEKDFVIKLFNDVTLMDDFYIFTIEDFIEKYNNDRNLFDDKMIDIYNYGYIYDEDKKICCYLITELYYDYYYLSKLKLDDKIYLCNQVIEFYSILKNNNKVIRDFRKENIGFYFENDNCKLKILDYEYETIVDIDYLDTFNNFDESLLNKLVYTIGYYYIPYYLYHSPLTYENYLYSDIQMFGMLLYDIICGDYKNINSSKKYLQIIYKNISDINNFNTEQLYMCFIRFHMILVENVNVFNNINKTPDNNQMLDNIKNIINDTLYPNNILQDFQIVNIR